MSNTFKQIDILSLEIPKRHQLLLSVVAPRPIALVATIDLDGRDNLAPFSFYNLFGTNPPYLGISPAFSGRDGSPKHTYLNILETKVFSVSLVAHSMLHQVNLASSPYPKGEDEFIKCGFTKAPLTKIGAKGVAESPCILECKLHQLVELGGTKGSGNLLIGEIVMMHIKNDVFDQDEKINPMKLDLLSRLGYDWWGRASAGLFELKRSLTDVSIGFEALPESIRRSPILTGNELGLLASPTAIPVESKDFVLSEEESILWNESLRRSEGGPLHYHYLIRDALVNNDFAAAWRWVYYGER